MSPPTRFASILRGRLGKTRGGQIADEKGYERDPGSFFTAKDGKVWVLVVDKATDASLWVSVSVALPNK
jgi:hypothetical protein